MKNNDILTQLYQQYPQLRNRNIENAFQLLYGTYLSGGKILICGNGGSASDSDHIVGELMKSFQIKRDLPQKEYLKFKDINDGEVIASKLQKAIPAISLSSQTALITAIGNDSSYDMIYAQQVYGYGKVDDCLIALSTSGNSTNIITAVKTAKALKMKTVGITGQQTCQLQELCDICIQVPSETTSSVQEYTLPIYHTLCAMLEAEAFGNKNIRKEE